MAPTGYINPADTLTIAAVDQRECEHPEAGLLLTFREAKSLPQPIYAACSRRYTAKRSSGKRPISQVWWIVMHDTEGDTAQGAAAWFANDDSAGSAHLCLDDRECYRTLADDVVPWGAAGANYHGFHIEQAGYAKWTTLWLSAHRKELERAAYKTALHCKKFGIPPTFVRASGLKLGVKGVTTHKECSSAFGGSHWDPGPGWPRRWFMRRVRYHFNRL